MWDRVVLAKQHPSLRAESRVRDFWITGLLPKGSRDVTLFNTRLLIPQIVSSLCRAKTDDTEKDRVDIDWHMPEGKNIKFGFDLKNKTCPFLTNASKCASASMKIQNSSSFASGWAFGLINPQGYLIYCEIFDKQFGISAWGYPIEHYSQYG